jgi:LysM repeat protein
MYRPMYRVMLGAFFLVCTAMAVTMIVWRVWWDPPVSADPSPAAQPTVEPTASAGPPSGEPGIAAPAGSGPVVTEVRVLQPSYVVAPGDTLASIARRHGTTIDALASLNNLENRNSLSVGQRLILP